VVIRTRNTGRNDDDVGILESGLVALILGQVAGDFLYDRGRPWVSCREFPTHAEQHVYQGVGLRTAGEEMWDRSAATPGVLTTSYRASSSTSGDSFRSSESGCGGLACVSDRELLQGGGAGCVVV
jgi:hypothetical protein